MSENAETMSRQDNAWDEVLARLSAMAHPPKAYYMVLADSRSDVPFLARHILIGLTVAVVQGALAAWCFASGMMSVGYAMAAIGLLGIGAAGHGGVMVWGRGKNRREGTHERAQLEGPEGWLWRYEGMLLGGIGDQVSDELVDSLLQTCAESKNRARLEDLDALRDYWLWVALLHDQALEATGQPPLGGIRIGSREDDKRLMAG